ncbi:carboxylesterase family protein [Aureibacter tunicatorum]|uniref:Dienelactone hydrolase n=1 Tax=Aureibacter tunicatorum TaxID=866807 RepID=A0AAE4BR95_9BACT|nr:alpha/beta hydrolase-fold protein [Aureibacter tunicatorum]MDR6237535.1 dienelactone hydrolase [Aureibacter tunicatorum]
MRKFFMSLALAAVSLSVSTAFAQQKQTEGNVVAYFGEEEKIAVHEGYVLHQFSEGFFVDSKLNYGRVPIAQDFLAKQIFDGAFNKPAQGAVAGVTKDGETVSWEMINASEDQFFNNEALRTGHLYLSYESDKEQVALMEATANTVTFINGMPHEGDHYNFEWSLVPFHMKKGNNDFLLTGGRFNKMKARIIIPDQPVQFTKRDVTLPDLILEEEGQKWGAIRIINSTNNSLKGYTLSAKANGEEIVSKISVISPMSVRKVPFQVEDIKGGDEGELSLVLTLKDAKGVVLDIAEMEINNRTKHKHHERTFVSDVDGSVQYYSVAPSTDKSSKNQAMFLSVHGASVQATNQSRAYAQKDWGFVVAATNRRPYGFAWEDWGRMDAMEVLADAEQLFETNPQHTYLTGHSMGGHGTWYLGATYPDRFAAIAPCAGYPELLSYASNHVMYKHATGKIGEGAVAAMFDRAQNPTKTKQLGRNYLQSGIYIHHGSDDTVVDVELARDMRNFLGQYHTNFVYYEYPGGTHWFGNESVDWNPIFNYFKWHNNPDSKDVNHIEFVTGSPSVSASNHWITIQQQETSFEYSKVDFVKEDHITGTTENVKTIVFDLAKANMDQNTVIDIDGQKVEVAPAEDQVVLQKQSDKWIVINAVNEDEKSPARNGGFRSSFDNRVVLVYGSKGSKAEREWYYNKARFDAETFWYRGNSTLELVKDVDFNPKKYQDRNVVIYGNANTNTAWNKLLKDSPVQVKNGKITIEGQTMSGDNLGAYFVQPRKDSKVASVGVVAGTGIKGAKAGFANQYFLAGPSFPDLMIFDDSMTTEGMKSVKVSGFFGNDWSVENGDFAWKEAL